MSKVKRGLQLSAAIIGIVFNSLMILGAIVVIGEILTIMGYGYSYNAGIFATAFVIILLCIANIVICSLICANPEKRGDKYEHKGLTITALVLSAVITLISSASGDFILLMPLTCCGLFIAVLCIPSEKKTTDFQNSMVQNATVQNIPNGDVGYNFKENSVSQIVTPENRKDIIRQAVENIEKKSGSSIDENITRIRKLYQESVLTADEMKQLIMEELKKEK